MCPEILQSCGTDLRNVTGQTFEKTVVPFSICRILMERMLRKDLASKGSTIAPRWHTSEQLPDLPFSQPPGDNWNGYWLKHWYIFAHWCLMVVIFRICLDDTELSWGLWNWCYVACQTSGITFVSFTICSTFYTIPTWKGGILQKVMASEGSTIPPKWHTPGLSEVLPDLPFPQHIGNNGNHYGLTTATFEIKCHTVSFVISMAWIYGEPHWCKDKIEGRERGQKRGDKRGAQSFCCIIEDECWVHWGMSAFWIIYILLMSALI